MNIDQRLYDIIESSVIDLVLSVPCILLKGILELINERKEILHIPVTREEEGVGIAAGAYLGGRHPVILMQNSGLGNSINAIKSLLELYNIPIIFIMSHRGGKGEKVLAQIPMGKITNKLLDVIGIKTWSIKSGKEITKLEEAITYSQEHKSSVGILLQKSLWGEEL
ncbi:MAG: sulfopyruvate decarboxylase subunit alpha [Candidatus Hermodarchaeota archaeon]